MSCAAKLNLCFKQGSDWIIPFAVYLSDGTTPLSLSGSTGVSKIRNNVGDVAALASFTYTITNGPSGAAQLSMAAAITAVLTMAASPDGTFQSTTYVYDLLITLSDGSVIAPFEGVIQCHPEASK